jgi:TolB-like protein/Tfp pilus assembly protein PilF
VIGRTVSHYQMVQELGRGGMGVVYKAHDLKLDRVVVLKLLPPVLCADVAAKRRFLHEARAASALDHPNICTIYDIEVTDDEQPIIAMGFYEGEILKDRIQRAALSIAAATEIARQIARGLAASHARGIVHRDVKPGNVLVTSEGVVKLLDFGLALLAGTSQIALTWGAHGTTAYMSPEQVRGKRVDQRTDIWSLGVVLHEMVTGLRPFGGDDAQGVIHSILTERPPSMSSLRPDVPPQLDRVVARALAKDPEDRYSSADELLADLSSTDAAAAGQRDAPQPAIAARRGKLALGGLGLVSLAVLIGAGTLVWRGIDSRKRAAAPAPIGDAATRPLRRLAVIPFDPSSEDPQSAYLGYALADQITEALTYVKGLLVRPASAERDHAGDSGNARALGQQLQVDYVLTGRYSSDPERVRLDVELVDVSSSAGRWREHFDVPRQDQFKLQDAVAEQVIRRLELEFSQEQRSHLQANVPQSALAYDYYLRSVSYPFTKEGTGLAIGALEQSVQLDSTYAPAHAELGHRFAHRAVYSLGGIETSQRSEAEYLKALSLDAELLEALGGLARLYTDVGQTAKAIGLLRRALAINPEHADSHFSLSYIYRYAGMLEESAREGETALALDPGNPRFRSVATTYLYLGDLQRSLQVHGLDPESCWTLARIGQIQIRLGNRDLALQYLNRAIEMEPESSTGRWARAMRAHLEGHRAEGLRALQENEEARMVDGEQLYHMANIHALLGDRSGCIRVLRSAVDSGFFNYPFMLRDSFLDPLRADPELQSILAQAEQKHLAFEQQFFPKRGQ